MELSILDSRNQKLIASLTDISPSSTIYDVKKAIYKAKKSLAPERQGLKLDAKGKLLSDDTVLSTLDLKEGKNLYVKDLGPQIGYRTVFLLEYIGPLVIYVYTYLRPELIYGWDETNIEDYNVAVNIALFCWVVHYVKRILETIFIHEFSHATMPIFNLYKNCTYYWGFALVIGYFINHPLYTNPYFDEIQILAFTFFFMICEMGNLSIHLLLRNIRPKGSKKRYVPYPTDNPLTMLYDSVSCPNYTYEFGAWLSFAMMTQCLPALLFAMAGLYQMTIWALQKHKAYLKMPDYPTDRKAIIPGIM